MAGYSVTDAASYLHDWLRLCVGFTSLIYARGASFVRDYWIGSRWDLHDSLPAEKQSPWLDILPPVHFPDDDVSMMLLSE